MSDFLTRLVTATYIPAASMRPRPVARYESAGAPLSAPPDLFETTAAVETTLTSEEPTHPMESRSRSAPRQRAAQATFEPQLSPDTHVVESGTAYHAALPTKSGSLAARARAANSDGEHLPGPALEPQLLSHARAASPLPAHAPIAEPFVTDQPVTRTQPAPVAPHTAQSPLLLARQPAKPPLLPLPAVRVRESDIFRRSPVIAPVDEQKSAADFVLPHHNSLAARREGVLRANMPASEGRRTEPGRHDEAAVAAEAPRTGRLASNQERAPAPQPAGENGTAPSAPVIRVSIGRIIVKAENPPAVKPAPARPAQPVLSLDGYLKTRSGGDA